MEQWRNEVDERLERFADAVRRSPHNLMSPRALAELTTRHIPESMALADLLPSGPLLDVGSGGGLPGLVIAVVRPDIGVTLLEATGKKARFLEETAAELGLAVRVIHARAEEVAGKERFPAVTARAVAPLKRLVRWTAPLLTVGGSLYAVKGAQWRQEVLEAHDALRSAGMAVTVEPDPKRGVLVVTITRTGKDAHGR